MEITYEKEIDKRPSFIHYKNSLIAKIEKIDKNLYAIAGLEDNKVKIFNQNLEVLKSYESHTDAA